MEREVMYCIYLSAMATVRSVRERERKGVCCSIFITESTLWVDVLQKQLQGQMKGLCDEGLGFGFEALICRVCYLCMRLWE